MQTSGDGNRWGGSFGYSVLTEFSQWNGKQGHSLRVRLGEEAGAVKGKSSRYEVILQDRVTVGGLVPEDAFKIWVFSASSCHHDCIASSLVSLLLPLSSHSCPHTVAE